MISVTINTRQAVVEEKERLTVGSVGIQVQFDFSSDWDELTQIACFKAGDEGAIFHVGIGANRTVVIPGSLFSSANEGEPLFAGAFGEKDGEIVIPTLWASLGAIRPSVADDSSESGAPEEYWRDSIAEIAKDAEDVAYEALDYASDAKATADNAAQAVEDLYDSIGSEVSAAQTAATAAETAASNAASVTAAQLEQTFSDKVAEAQTAASAAESAAQTAAADAVAEAQTQIEGYTTRAENAADSAEIAQAAAEAAAATAAGLIPTDASWITFDMDDETGDRPGWLYVITSTAFEGATFSINNDNGPYQGWLEVNYE